MGRGVDWAAQGVAQLRQWLEEGRKPREMRAMRPDWSLESIKTKLKQLRPGAPDQPRPLKWRRTTEVLAEIEVAVTETPRQTLSVLRRHSSLDMSHSTLWRALHEDLQARCLKPVRAPRLTAENRLARLTFCRDVLQRVGVLSVRGIRHLKPLDLTRVVFSDEKFFRWNYIGLSQNSPIWVVEAHGRPARKADLDPDVCINEHSQRNPDGIVLPPCLIEEGVRINTDCYIRMLDDVYLPHCMARLGTDTSSWRWQEGNAPSHTSRRTKAFLKEHEIQLLTCLPCSPDLSPLDFHLWQEWETAVGDRQVTSQLELRAMIVRTLSALDPEAAEKACTTGHRCLACVRARGGHFEHRLCTRFFYGLVRPVLKHGPKSLTVEQVFCGCWNLQAP